MIIFCSRITLIICCPGKKILKLSAVELAELMPWVRTFIGRIEKIECTNPEVTARFRETLREMAQMYGGGTDVP